MYENKHEPSSPLFHMADRRWNEGVQALFLVCRDPNIFKARQKNPKTTQAPACAARVQRAGHVYPNNPLWQELAGNKWCRKCPRSLSVRVQQQSISITHSLIVFTINRASPEQSVPCLMQMGAGCVWNLCLWVMRALTWFSCGWSVSESACSS